MKELITVKSIIAGMKGFDGDSVGSLWAQVNAQKDVLLIVDQREVVGGVCCVGQSEDEGGLVLKDRNMVRME